MTTVVKRVSVANNAGRKPWAPLLAGLCLRVVWAPYSRVLTAVPTFKVRPAAVDAGYVVPISPSASVLNGSAGVLSDIGIFSDAGMVPASFSVAGVSAGDFMFVRDDTGEMKTGVYEVLSIDDPAAKQARLGNPYRRDGQELWPWDAAKTGLTWRMAYRCALDTSSALFAPGRSPLTAPEGNLQESPWKYSTLHAVEIDDGTDLYIAEFFLRECSEENLVWFDGSPWQGFVTGKQDRQRVAIDFCRDPGFSNHGGIGTVDIVSGDLYWDPAHTKQDEVTIEQAIRLGVYATSGTGTKSATFRLRARTGDSIYVDVDVSLTVVDSREHVNQEVV